MGELLVIGFFLILGLAFVAAAREVVHAEKEKANRREFYKKQAKDVTKP